jgi:hypothetical protein
LDGAKVKVLGPNSPINRHLTTGPSGRVPATTTMMPAAELQSVAVEAVDDGGNAWVHLRAPDGHIYPVHPGPGVS